MDKCEAIFLVYAIFFVFGVHEGKQGCIQGGLRGQLTSTGNIQTIFE